MIKQITVIYGSMLTIGFITFFLMTTMSFTSTLNEMSFLGPGALVLGMIVAIIWLVKRDKELRDQIKSQNEKLIDSQSARIKELEAELKSFRKL